MHNVVDWILFADAKTCALLKEHAKCYFAARVNDVLAQEESKKLEESPRLWREIMVDISRDPSDCFGDNLSVDELRGKLDQMGLDVDGSKEMLVNRLDTANQSQKKK
ncbi:hypothetical protein ACHAXR_009239 [Thalassiosira sp. AJA248-18]